MDNELVLLTHRMGFLDYREKCLLLDTAGDVGRLRGLGLADLAAIVGRRLRPAEWAPDVLWRRACRDAEWLAAGQGSLLRPGRTGYPDCLAEIADPPFALFCRGRAPGPERELLAVVGTRRPSEAGRLAAWDLGAECAGLGIGLVSGLALGIDGAAQAATVDARGYTVAVTAGGIDRVHPAVHRELARRIIDGGGCLMSEYGPGTETLRYQFPVRNRIISGLCPVTVVIEAPERSGALITAQFALDQGREVYVHAAGCQSSQGSGTRNLAEAGSRVIRSLAELVIACGQPGP